MHKPRYDSITAMIELFDEINRDNYRRLYAENKRRFLQARGSTHNHQTWEGGYHDHVEDGMNYVILFYQADASTGRTMPFTLREALEAFFDHDLEKPWRFEKADDGSWRNTGLMKTKADRQAFRLAKLAEYGIRLTPKVLNAVTYAEGEGDDYRPDRRVSNELAAMVHMCDNYSARARHDYPRPGDPWSER